MKKAVFIDFYGTLVHEGGPIAAEVVQRVCASGKEKNPQVVYRHWWTCFNACVKEANAEKFYNQYTLARRAFAETVAAFSSGEDPDSLCRRMIEHWAHPAPFPDSGPFLDGLRLPYYVISNGDSVFLDAALCGLDFHPAGVVSSEKAQAYKPDPRIFQAALREAGLNAGEVLHIGDSMDNDANAAKALGIEAFWLNRGGEGQGGFGSLTEILERLTEEA